MNNLISSYRPIRFGNSPNDNPPGSNDEPPVRPPFDEDAKTNPRVVPPAPATAPAVDSLKVQFVVPDSMSEDGVKALGNQVGQLANVLAALLTAKPPSPDKADNTAGNPSAPAPADDAASKASQPTKDQDAPTTGQPAEKKNRPGDITSEGFIKKRLGSLANAIGHRKAAAPQDDDAANPPEGHDDPADIPPPARGRRVASPPVPPSPVAEPKRRGLGFPGLALLSLAAMGGGAYLHSEMTEDKPRRRDHVVYDPAPSNPKPRKAADSERITVSQADDDAAESIATIRMASGHKAEIFELESRKGRKLLEVSLAGKRAGYVDSDGNAYNASKRLIGTVELDDNDELWMVSSDRYGQGSFKRKIGYIDEQEVIINDRPFITLTKGELAVEELAALSLVLNSNGMPHPYAANPYSTSL